MKPLVVIPARGGSKGIPGKNIRLLGRTPLIEYTIQAARAVFPDQIICVSTDSEEIKECAASTGLHVPFLRPPELATDTADTRGVLLHALSYYHNRGYAADTLVLLQPTSPFRSARHISEALQLFSPEIDMVVSVKEAKANPYFSLFEEDNLGFLQLSKKGNFTQRQACPTVWEFNGAVYIINAESVVRTPIGQFQRVVKYVMDEESSLDLDTEIDWLIAEALINRK